MNIFQTIRADIAAIPAGIAAHITGLLMPEIATLRADVAALKAAILADVEPLVLEAEGAVADIKNIFAPAPQDLSAVIEAPADAAPEPQPPGVA